MPIYRKCTQCGKKVLQGTLCICEQKKKLESYRDYKRRRMRDKEEKERQKFYSSDTWIRCRDNVASHQFGLDLIEWSKGNIVAAETHHHIVELAENYTLRLDENNIIGLTQKNHLRIHALMNRSDKDKKEIQDALRKILQEFNNKYY